jgi:hypothetical protein
MIDPYDDRLRYIEQIEYRGYAIKIARKGDEIRLLIYPPDVLLATHRVADSLSNYEEAIDVAKRKVDHLLRDDRGTKPA